PLQKGAALFCAPGVPTIKTHPAKILPPPLYLVLQRTICHQTKLKNSKNPAAKCLTQHNSRKDSKNTENICVKLSI
ncbi:UNVERIFIED_CONTAM: hypothetical protein NY603_42020, partial [Bacteroidetes bacterium 56_B9]